MIKIVTLSLIFPQTVVEYTDLWYVFYPGGGSYRTIGLSPLPEEADKLDPNDVVIGNSNER